jgi:hypothetical protein
MILFYAPTVKKEYLINNFDGSSLKCMGKAVCNMIEIRDQEIEEVDTDRHERHGSFSVGFGFETAMVCGIV